VFTRRADALPQKKRALQGRRLVVVEIENIARGALRTRAHASWARRLITEAVALERDEQVIVGVSHGSVLVTWAAWPETRIVTAPRPGGVQRALLEILQGERIAGRFDKLVLASGNGIFADAIAELGGDGVEVTALAWPESCSKRLRMAAARTHFLGTRHGRARRAA
jgi:hypothetical protein